MADLRDVPFSVLDLAPVSSGSTSAAALLRAGYPELLPSPECAAAYPYTDAERQAIQTRQAHQIVGDPETVQRGFDRSIGANGGR